MNDIDIINLNIENIDEHGCYCLMNKKQKGHTQKIDWLKKRFQEGLKAKILRSKKDGNIGYIEYISGELSWRAFSDPDYMFIHCIYIAKKNNRNMGYGKLLIDECMDDAKKENKKGAVMITSGGAMLAEKDIFLKNGFVVSDTQLPKYQLMVKQFFGGELPKLEKNQEKILKKYDGLYLIYADQCPYFIKSVDVVKKVSKEYGIGLNVLLINNAKDAQQAPSFYGTFNLIYDGKLIAEHYISEKRFRNILEKELKTGKTKEHSPSSM